MQRSTRPSGQPGARGPATAVVAPSAGSLASQTIATPLAEAIGPAGDAYEREADRVADAVVRGARARFAGGWAEATAREPARIRRAPKDAASASASAMQADAVSDASASPSPSGAAAAAEPALASEAAAPSPSAAAAATTTAPAGAVGDAPAADSVSTDAGPAMLVDDEAEAVSRGQMRKAEFLAALREAVCATVDAGLSGTGRDSQGCPFIDNWFGFYEGRTASQIERSVRRYVPAARGVATARDYIPLVTARIGRSASRWARTGEITGVPEDMPGGAMAGGGVLGAFGGMFFKARPGGPRHEDPVSVRAALGSGRSMPGPVRKRMESAFSTRFDSVRFHTDTNAAHLSDRLNARAFTVGEHVAFGGGEFRPGTMAGDALIAHELAHVVQQGHHGATPAGPFHKGEPGGGQPASAFEDDADLSAAGAVATLWGGARGQLADIGRQAMPRMRSGLQLQRCSPKAVTDPSKGAKTNAQLSVREARDQAIGNAGAKLREVNDWASAQMKVQGRRSTNELKGPEEDPGAKTIPPQVAEAIALLEKAQSLFGTKEIEALPQKLDAVTMYTKDARAKSPSPGEQDVLARREAELLYTRAMQQAVAAADDASKLVSVLSKSFDVDTVAKKVDEIVGTLNDMQNGKVDILDAADRVVKLVKQAKEALHDLHERFDKTPAAIGRVLFILRSFVALNAPGTVTPPTADEIKQFTGKLGDAASDFSTVFADGKPTQGFSFFEGYAAILEQQLAVRAAMAKAGVNAEAPIPTLGNARDYFKALKAKPNKDVFDAYQDYARAFFFHRVIDVFHDMEVKGVEDFYARPLSIAGLRPLVCTGYALLGSHLLRFAGATLTRFIVAVRADNADIENDRVAAGHALAVMSRGGKEFFISNDSIVNTEDEGIGPNAVAWEKSAATLRKATGSTIPGANQKLGDQLRDIKDAILKARAKAAAGAAGKPGTTPPKKK
jgi:hypothetical protein